MNKKQLANLKKLLFHEEPGPRMQGVALAGALADPEIHHHLLEHCSFKVHGSTVLLYVDKPWPRAARRKNELVATVLGLYANAPEGTSYARVRDGLTKLSLSPTESSLDLTILASFPNLRRLQISGGCLENTSALAELEHLETFSTSSRLPDRPQWPASLRWLTIGAVDPAWFSGLALKGLQYTQVPGPTWPFQPRLDELESLRLSFVTHDVDFRRFPRLRRLDLRSCRQSELLLPRLEALRLSSVRGCGLPHLPVDELIFGTPPLDLEHLDDLPERCLLQNPLHLNLAGRKSLRSIRQVGRFSQVRHLDLQGCTSLITLQGVDALEDLEVLDLRGCSGLEDISALAELACIVLTHDTPVTEAHAPKATLDASLRPDLRALRRG